MSYAVHSRRRPPRFATLPEARKAANDHHARTGVIVAITESKRPATHTFEEDG
ncbi:hypothetical protein vBCbaSRXM_21 [Citromicrobium phage vB_CbaS-RXM]|nr:hypothetical protein vBCbaSRXM_21 [Citromicrobium phage vB_CbaS-RXM]